MTALMSFVDQSWAQALAWTLVHFIWQGGAIGLAAYLTLRLWRLSSPARYGVAVAALAAMLIAPAATFAVLATDRPADTAVAGRVPATDDAIAGVSAATGIAASRSEAQAEAETTAAAAPGAQPSGLVTVVLIAWMAGVLTLSVRLLGGWLVARRLVTRAVRPVSPDVHAMARRVAGRLALDRIVRFVESSAVAVPVTVGWMKPVVLLPAAAMTGLTTQQVEALVAHELAHVRRHDYLVNLLQSAVETLLFYHPAVWWASRVIRTEREHCCDDIAVGVCDRVVYVSALSDLAALASTPRLAMAATSGSLLARVRRLLGQPGDDGAAGSGWLPAGLVVLLAAALVPVALAQAGGAEQGAARPAGQARGVVVVGEARGVASGVNEGVVTGVTQGVQGGVATGVSGGVRGGVSSGAGGGVAVVQTETRTRTQTGTQTRADRRTDAERQQRATELERALADLRARLESERVAIEQARAKVAMTFGEQEASARLQALRAELQAAENQHERTRRRVEVGVANPSALLEEQAELARIQQDLRRTELEMARQAQEMQLRLRELNLREDYGRQVRDLESALAAARARREIGAQGSAAERAERTERVEASVEELRAALEQMLRSREAEIDAAQRDAARTGARSADLDLQYALSTEVTDPDAQVQARDVLVIRISNEPNLPTAYQVDTDGAIRLPLLGTVQVGGRTAAQVRTAVSDMLADRQLAQGSTITVTLRRPRPPTGAP
jgi:beta-lactamase regulating signal transducer with metallopeptidase domain